MIGARYGPDVALLRWRSEPTAGSLVDVDVDVDMFSAENVDLGRKMDESLDFNLSSLISVHDQLFASRRDDYEANSPKSWHVARSHCRA